MTAAIDAAIREGARKDGSFDMPEMLRVKAELLKSRTADANKISHLKALRLAKEAEEQISNPQPAVKPIRRKAPMARSSSGTR